MNTYTILRTRSNSLRFGALLLAVLGLLLLGAKPSQAQQGMYFNTLNPKTGAIMKSWKIESFAWGAANATPQPTSFNMMWSENAAAEILLEAAATGSPIAHASLTFYRAGKLHVTYKFTHLQVMSVQVAGGSGGSDTPTESATLTFQQVAVFYQP